MDVPPREAVDQKLYDPLLSNIHKCLPVWVNLLTDLLPTINPYKSLTEKIDPAVAIEQNFYEKVNELLKDSYKLVERREDKPAQWNERWKSKLGKIEENTTSIYHFSLVMSLGILAPVYRLPLGALYQLLDCGYGTARVTAALAIMYAGYTPPTISEIDLLYIIEDRLIYFIPYNILIKILPGLAPTVMKNSEIANACMSALASGDINHFGRNVFYPTEFALMLADAGYSARCVYDELTSYTKKIYSFKELSPLYRSKCLAAAARLLEKDPALMSLTEEQLAELFPSDLSDDEMNGWAILLDQIDPLKTSPGLASLLEKISARIR